jgi:hypothetical protein
LATDAAESNKRIETLKAMTPHSSQPKAVEPDEVSTVETE